MELSATKTPSLSHGSSSAPARALGRAFTLIELIVVIVIIGVLAAVAAVAYNSFIAGANDSGTEAGATQIGKIISAESALKQVDMNSYDDITDYPQSVLDDINAALNVNVAHVTVNPLGTPAQFALGGTAPTSVLIDGEISVCNSDYSYCVSGALPITPGEPIAWGFISASGSSGSGGSSDPDTDGDGFTDAEEAAAGSDPNNPASTPNTDDDSDGFTNSEETLAGSDPNNPASTPDDLDGDGFSNTDEVTAGTDPNDPTSFPFYQANGVTYELADAHSFVANSNPVNLPIPSGTAPLYITVDGVARDYATEVRGQVFNGSTIRAIFDWDNYDAASQDWIADITNFGLNSVTGQRNQLKDVPAGREPGSFAFYRMSASPSAVSNLDVSNLTDLNYAFAGSSFNGDLSSWDVSNVRGMVSTFAGSSFSGDLSSWDTSSVEDMTQMFASSTGNPTLGANFATSTLTSTFAMFDSAANFNQDISGWDVSNVIPGYMNNMFAEASSFNQDLSGWCVTNHIDPPDFAYRADAWTLPKPVWGTCPQPLTFPITVGSETYEEQDFHIFVTNGNQVKLPTWAATVVAVDGYLNPNGNPFFSAPAGATVHAVFDWDNSGIWQDMDWFSDITQFGLNSVTGERNQIAYGTAAFMGMQANPSALENLDVSNLTTPIGMLSAPGFNRDISGWDTSNMTDMMGMFIGASSFNQDLSGWCVSNITSEPDDFDIGATAWSSPQPVWGTCP